MKWLLTALTVVGISLASTGARADEADIRATYKDFAAAQNARDLHKIGALLLEFTALPMGQRRPIRLGP